MKRFAASTLCFAFLAATPAWAADSPQDFVTKASIANIFEIETSQVALKRSQDDDVRSFAQKMVTDHSKAGGKLKSTLASAKLKYKPAKTLDSEHADKLAALKATDDAEFDTAYIEIQKDAHDEAISLFSDYADNGSNGALKQFASKTLPTLQMHQDHVQKLDAK